MSISLWQLPETEVPQGTLDMLIVKTLDSDGEPHGFQIANAIQERTEEVLRADEVSIYPALQRLLLKGWLTGEWGKTAENRRARLSRLTRPGPSDYSKRFGGMAD